MRTVWKFALIGGPHLDVELPEDSKPLSARIQGPPFGDDGIQVWVELDRSLMNRTEKLVRFDFYAVNTGAVLPQGYVNLQFLDTVEAHTGIIWHVYWRKESRQTETKEER